MFDLDPHSASNPFRRRRIEVLNGMIAGVLSAKPNCRIIDIGGTRDYWHTWRSHIVGGESVTVDCVNTDEGHASETGYTGVSLRTGDARDLHWVGDQEYDIAFSNSVIEHVGRWKDMVQMANEVRRVGVRYLVQSPYYWFPIEPHMRIPLVHWLPESLGYRVAMTRKLGFFDRQSTVAGAMEVVQDSRLLDIRQMSALFPDAVMHKERFMGLVKSLVAKRA